MNSLELQSRLEWQDEMAKLDERALQLEQRRASVPADVLSGQLEAGRAGAAVSRVVGRMDAGLAILEGRECIYEQQQSDERKLFATVRACAALRGVVLVELKDDAGRPEYIASMGAMTKAFSDMDELVRWLARIEVKRA